MASRTHEPEPMGDFGWGNQESYALAIGAAFAQHKILPEPGGFNNQYEDDWRDIATYMAGYNRAVWEESKDDERSTPHTVESGEYPDWAEYTR